MWNICQFLQYKHAHDAWFPAACVMPPWKAQLGTIKSALLSWPHGFPGGSHGKESDCQCGRPGFNPWVGKIPWRRGWLPTPVFWPGESHRQRSLVGLQPMGSQEAGHDWVTSMHSLKLATHTTTPESNWGSYNIYRKSVFQHKKEVFSHRIPGKEKSPRQTLTTPRGVLTRREEGLATWTLNISKSKGSITCPEWMHRYFRLDAVKHQPTNTSVFIPLQPKKLCDRVSDVVLPLRWMYTEHRFQPPLTMLYLSKF